MRTESWRPLAGLATWMAAAAPAVVGFLNGQLAGPRLVAWCMAWLAFLAAFSGSYWTRAVRHRRVATGLLAVQTTSALVMVGLGHDRLAGGVLLVVVAGQLLGTVRAAGAAAWIVLQTMALIALLRLFMGSVPALTYGLSFGGFQLFALGTAALAQRERHAHQALAVAHAELHATRALMAEHSRVAERLRISRDLHDTLGHHLTALSLQLDVASRLTVGRAAEHVAEAHALAKLLLADVRDVVGQLRESSRFDLTRAVRSLAEASTGALVIEVDMPTQMPLFHDASAHALLRCVQEIVTNAVRHSEARHLWIRIEAGIDGIGVVGRDDGRGAARVLWGHGLTGMRERFEALNGRLDVSTGDGGGFEVRGFLPLVEAAS